MPPKGWRKPHRPYGTDAPEKQPEPEAPQREYAATWTEDLAMQLKKVPDDIFVEMLTRSGLTKQEQRDLIESFRRNKK